MICRLPSSYSQDQLPISSLSPGLRTEFESKQRIQMLSAIAARKAAQAAQQNSKLEVDAEPQPSKPGGLHVPSPSSESGRSSSSTSTPESKPVYSQKRKSKGENLPRKKRPKRFERLTNADIGRTRYFEAEQPIAGFDYIDFLPSKIPHTPRAYSPSQLLDDSLQEDEIISGFITEDPGPSGGFSPSRPVLDSSEEEIEYLPKESQPESFQNSQGEERGRAFIPKLNSNTFRLIADDLKSLHILLDVGDRTGTLIILPPGYSLTFVGTASITLLHGTVMLLGTFLRPSPRSHRVFSPRSNPVASIEALKYSSVEENSTSLLDSTTRSLPQRIKTALQDSDSVIVIQPLRTGVEGLGIVHRTFYGVFDAISDVRDEEGEETIGVEGFYPVDPQLHPHPQLQPFLLPETWEHALNEVIPSHSSPENPADGKSLVTLVRGPRKCGKSTFARTLLNRLAIRYRRVAFLECDLGQSEFTPGGMISLHVISEPVFGPPFTHQTLPYRAHYVGHSTPRSSPSHYLSCIQALMLTYRMDIQYSYQETPATNQFLNRESALEDTLDAHENRIQTTIPLVVNTQGWVKGLGGDLLRKIEEIVEATDIIDLDTQANMVPRQRMQTSTARIHVVRPIHSSLLATFYTPADHRSLSVLSYFYGVFPVLGKGVRTWATGLPLCARAPWEIACKDAIDSIVLVGAGFEDVAPHELEYAINCGLVALVCDEGPMEKSAIEETEYDAPSWPYTQGAPPPSPSTSHCVGLALVRGVDAATRTLHLLTPIPPELFSKCRMLVKGELELPVWGMLDFRTVNTEGVAGVKWEKVPYLQMGGGDSGAIGGTRRRIRKNLMRRGQM